jgi:undecaprenyl-diphosphatase
MNGLQAAILGLVQGLTEFLPVSSSGHLVLFQKLMGFCQPELLFDISVHVGTLFAVLVVFRRDIFSMLRGFWANDLEARQGRRLLILVIAGSIPTAIIGLVFKDTFEALFCSATTVGIALIITGLFLMATHYAKNAELGIEQTGVGRAILIGIAQGMAITPGISRSGATIAAGLLLGVNREVAARFSFVLSIPAILGAMLLHLKNMDTTVPTNWTPSIIGAVVAAITGYIALKLLLKVVRRGHLHWFAYYCWAVGLLALVWSFASA